MALFFSIISVLLSLSVIPSVLSQSKRPHINPSIIQDSRDLPQVDGAFGFLYQTEDGIAHGAVGEPGGQVHGRYTYTDPTGLKVNFNYNAGTRTAPGANYEQNQPGQQAYNPPPAPLPLPRPHSQARPRPLPRPAYEYEEEPQYQPQPRPRPQPVYDLPQPQHRLQPRPQPSQSRYSRPPAPQNDVDYGSYSF